MKKFFVFMALVLTVLSAQAQTIVVPENMYFAGLHLKLKDSGRKEIQKYVDALHKHPAYFENKVNRTDTYFPIIERIFREEGVPEDFKYLAVQESGLVPDAVSTSNAVGFWQFKKEAASDFGLQVNDYVDERKHILESSRGAAKYLQRSNNYYKNWINTLLSYNLGFTGAKSYAKPSDMGAGSMDITDKTHVYVLTFLAHKIAFENHIGKKAQPVVMLQEMKANPGQTLFEIAQASHIDQAELESYNKWLSGSSIPSDKNYTVLIPISKPAEQMALASSQLPEKIINKTTAPVYSKAEIVLVNGIRAIVAQKGDTKDKLALQAGISTRKFLKFNDMNSFEQIKEGEAYYVNSKRTKSTVEYHTAQAGEKIRDIAQRYGLKASVILRKNRMKKNEVLVEGRVIWLMHTRPRNVPVEFRSPRPKLITPVLEMNESNEATDLEKMPVKPTHTTYQELDLEPAAEINNETQKPAEAQAIAPVTETAPEAPQQESVIAEPAKTAEPKQETNLKTVYPVKAETTELQPVLSEDQTIVEAPAKPATPPTEEPAPKPAEVAKAEPQQVKPEPKPVQATVAATPAAKSHKVAQGETLYAISKKYGVTVDNLKAWNNLGAAPISIGQVLQLTAPSGEKPDTEKQELINIEPVTTTTLYHTVGEGESMYQISRKYGVTIKDIMEWNRKSDFNVSMGEKLMVKARQTEE